MENLNSAIAPRGEPAQAISNGRSVRLARPAAQKLSNLILTSYAPHNYDLPVVTLETAVVKRGDFMATNLLKDPFNAVPSSLGIELDWRVPSS